MVNYIGTQKFCRVQFLLKQRISEATFAGTWILLKVKTPWCIFEHVLDRKYLLALIFPISHWQYPDTVLLTIFNIAKF